MVWLIPGASMRRMHRSTVREAHTLQGENAIQATAADLALVLIEPDDNVRDALATLLRGEGWVVIEAKCGKQLERLLNRPGVVAVISESSLPDLEPAALLNACTTRKLPLVFTGHELSLQRAVDLIRMGASDYLEKPFPQSRLLDLLKQLPARQNS